MKNKINTSAGSVAKTTAQFILAATLLFTACKKNSNTNQTEPEPVPAPTSVNPFTASVSGSTFSTAVSISSGTYTAYQIIFSHYVSGNTNRLYIDASSGYSKPNFGLYLPFSTGTFSLSSPVAAFYSGYFNTAKDSLTSWYATSGSVNITEIDTSGLAVSSSIKKLKATFTFSTNLNKSITHNITNGVIDYKKP